jgi:hypothetical protein
MRRIYTLAVFIISFFQLYSQSKSFQITDSLDTAKWCKKSNRIGAYASIISGFGLSYQHQFENGFSLKAQTFGFGSMENEENYDDQFVANIGFDVQYNLLNIDNTSFYALVGGMYLYEENYEYNALYNGDFVDSKEGLHIGFGVGLEYKLFYGYDLSIAIELGYFGRFSEHNTYMENVIDNKTEFVPVTLYPKYFAPGAGVGLFYAF